MSGAFRLHELLGVEHVEGAFLVDPQGLLVASAGEAAPGLAARTAAMLTAGSQGEVSWFGEERVVHACPAHGGWLVALAGAEVNLGLLALRMRPLAGELRASIAAIATQGRGSS